MRVLFVSQHYWPEPFNSTDICEELARRGHDVCVLTGQPNYPEGRLYPGYENQDVRVEDRNGVVIVRSQLHPRKSGPVHRVWNYYSFSRNAQKVARALPDDFDVVYAYQTSPIMMVNPAIAYAREHDVPLLLHCVDIWPECLTAGGIKPGSVVYNHFLKVSRAIYAEADRLAVTSRGFTDYLRSTVDVPMSEEPLYLPQYAEDLFTQDDASAAGIQTPANAQASAPTAPHTHFMFAGNVGAAQSVVTLVEAAALLTDEPFTFHVVGSGSELEHCQQRASQLGLDNIVFHGRHPLEEMPAYYAQADAMLALFANSPVLAYTLPRKVQSYMAAGKPVIGTVLGAARQAVEEAGCGLCCDPEDPAALAQLCREFAALAPDEQAELGRNGRRFYDAHFTRPGFFATLETELQRLKGTGHGR